MLHGKFLPTYFLFLVFLQMVFVKLTLPDTVSSIDTSHILFILLDQHDTINKTDQCFDLWDNVMV